MRERDELEGMFCFYNDSKDKRARDLILFESILDIRDILTDCRELLFKMNYEDDEGMCHCPECEKLRIDEEEKEQEEIVIEELSEEKINELYEKENGNEDVRRT